MFLVSWSQLCLFSSAKVNTTTTWRWGDRDIRNIYTGVLGCVCILSVVSFYTGEGRVVTLISLPTDEFHFADTLPTIIIIGHHSD